MFKKDNTLPYIIGMIFNITGFFIGSQFLISIVSVLLKPSAEYKSFLMWAITGLVVATFGNLIGVLITTPRNYVGSFIGAIIGLIIGIGLSLVPYLYFAGLITIFFGTMIGHRYDGNKRLYNQSVQMKSNQR